jgi:hypothetical protein
VPIFGRRLFTATVPLRSVAGDNSGEMGGRVASPTLVGRIEELQVLEAARRRAADADPAVVLVGGEAGVGTGLRRSRGCVMLPGCAVCRGIAQPTGAAGVDATWQACWVASSWW